MDFLKKIDRMPGRLLPSEAFRLNFAGGCQVRASSRRGEQAVERGAQFRRAVRIDQPAAPPVTSGNDERFEVITGTPAAMACATGKPKPS